MLDSLRIPELSYTRCSNTAVDSLEKCLDIEHYLDYPHEISYSYNSRGFRDLEWPPVDQLSHSIWCVGDSFTAGVGSVFEYIWPQVLGQHASQRTIAVSMEGASNDWIARQSCKILDQIQPTNLVIMWSYLHRRESTESGSDLERRRHYVKSTVAQDYQNLIECRQQVKAHNTTTNIIELIIPEWQPAVTQSSWLRLRDDAWPAHVSSLTMDDIIVRELVTMHGIDRDLLLAQITAPPCALAGVMQVPMLDRSRDGYHFDLITSRWVSKQVQTKLVTV